MEVLLTEEERQFLKQSLMWARSGYEKNCAQYISGPLRIEGYYSETYVPKIRMFQSLQEKLNKRGGH